RVRLLRRVPVKSRRTRLGSGAARTRGEDHNRKIENPGGGPPGIRSSHRHASVAKLISQHPRNYKAGTKAGKRPGPDSKLFPLRTPPAPHARPPPPSSAPQPLATPPYRTRS